MSIRKVVEISNVGRLTNLTASGDVTFKRLTLIYGTNGNGKTTLASVLRSLQTGDAAYIYERATLGANSAPKVELLLSDGNARFIQGTWDKTKPELEIFDSSFVNENVYTGDRIDQEHRKNLYQVVVGASGVRLAKQIDEIDADSRGVARKISDVEEKLRKHIQAPFDLDDFLILEAELDLDKRIADCTAKLNATRKEREVLSRPALESLNAPDAPSKVVPILNASIEKIAEDATRKVQDHFQTKLGHGGEHWIRQGIGFLHDDKCPFCGQSTDNVELVSLFKSYFSDTYNERVVEIQSAINEVKQTLGDDSITHLTKRVMENEARIASWSDLANLTSARFNADRLEATWRNLRNVLLERLQKKLAQPNLPLGREPDVEAAIRDYCQSLAALRQHNDQIQRANTEISNIKKQAASTEAPKLEAELRRLRNMQIRQQAEVASICSELVGARIKKKELEEKKKSVRAELEQQAESLLSTYEGAINRLLSNFGATFQVTGTKPSFAGGKASSTYQIAINNVPIDLGDSRTPRGKPCFRTALSAGDKSTLALAVFMARLQQDATLQNKIVVFDDPLSSLDLFRVACTQQEICKIAERAEQVVVLSHDPFFLKQIFDCGTSATTKALQFVRDGETHTLKGWDIKDYFLREAHHDYIVLRDFMANGLPLGGDTVAVARSIRPYIEGHLRYRFPDEMGTNECLGDFIGKIQKASQPNPLCCLQPKLQELTDLNEYARRFHHTGATPGTTTDTEVHSYISRAITFVQGTS